MEDMLSQQRFIDFEKKPRNTTHSNNTLDPLPLLPQKHGENFFPSAVTYFILTFLDTQPQREMSQLAFKKVKSIQSSIL